MGRLTESSILNLHNKSYAVTADIVVPKEGAEGVIIALGGLTGGWSLYAKGGKAKHCYNFFGLEESVVEGKTQLPEGRHQVRVEFTYDGGGPAKGGKLTLYLDGKPDGEGRVERTEPQIFSADETCDIGTEFGSPVTRDYDRREFNGVVNWVQLDQGEDAKNAEHYIKPEERLNFAMAVQ
jgi:arylsulfatase